MQKAALVGGAIGVSVGLILAIVAAILRGPIPASVVIGAMGAVLMMVAGAFLGALVGSVIGLLYRAVLGLLTAWQGQVEVSAAPAVPIQQQTGHPAASA
jgi:hypothetical protein